MEALVLKLQKGDPAAANELAAQYGVRLLQAAYLLTHNAADAEDLKMQTLEAALATISSYRGDSSLFSWLYGILFNRFRCSRRRKIDAAVSFVAELPDDNADSAPGPADQLDQVAEAALVRDAVGKLSEPLREVVIMRYFSDLPIAEIASALGIPPGTVKSRLFNASEALRALLPVELRDHF